jgi:hypothetical protein
MCGGMEAKHFSMMKAQLSNWLKGAKKQQDHQD